jgi:hypothetical protein
VKGQRFSFSDTKTETTIQDNDFTRIVTRAKRKFNIRLKTDEEVIFELKREIKTYKKYYESRLTPQEIEYLKKLRKRLGFR